MKDTLVIVVQQSDNDGGFGGGPMQWSVEGMREAAHAVELPEVDPDLGRWYEDCKGWLTTEQDAPLVVDKVTGFFPGKDVRVYKLVGIHIRPAGEMVSKDLSPSGILPK